MKSAYEILGVAHEADDPEIERAYFARLAKPQAWSKIEALKEAYRTLSDGARRKRHDFILRCGIRTVGKLPAPPGATPEEQHARRTAETHFDGAARMIDEGGLTNAAAAGLEKAVTLAPAYREARIDLALVYLATGRDADAVAQLDSLAASAPTDLEAAGLAAELRTVLGLPLLAPAVISVTTARSEMPRLAAARYEEPLPPTPPAPVPPPVAPEREETDSDSDAGFGDPVLGTRLGVLAALQLLRHLMETKTTSRRESADVARMMDAVLEQVPPDLAAVGCEDLRAEFKNVGAFLLAREPNR